MPIQRDSVRVAVVHEQALLRHGLAAALSAQPGLAMGLAVACAADDRLAVSDRSAPEVVFASLREGLALLSQGAGADTRSCGPTGRPQVAIVLPAAGESEILQALKAGARGLLLQDAQPEELHACAVALAARGRHVTPALGALLARHAQLDPLTPREQAVLARLVEGDSNKTIGRTLGVSEGTVKTHVKSVLAKLGVRSRTEAAAVALRRGLVGDGASGSQHRAMPNPPAPGEFTLLPTLSVQMVFGSGSRVRVTLGELPAQSSQLEPELILLD